jgi:uncharacterized membrane protein
MAAGYGFGAIMLRDVDQRRRLLLGIGLSATAAFVVGAIFVAKLGEPPEDPVPFYIQVLNQQKYPPSVLYLLMTLGPMIALLPFVERAQSWALKALELFGRVPMFYYLLHIPAIHVAAVIVNQIRAGTSGGEWYATAPYAQVPPEHRWSLWLLYLVWAIVVIAVLYPACRWYARVKATKGSGWMRYV